MSISSPLTDPSAALPDHIELLRETLRKLSGTATLKEISAQFAAQAEEFFPSSTIELLHRAREKGEWERIAVRGSSSSGPTQSPPEISPSSPDTLQQSPEEIALTRRLSDGSELGILLSQKGNRGRFSTFDGVRLRLFSQLLESTLQESLHRKAEKELLFSLNHRLLQLNSLIDTGIDIAKLDRHVSPIQLAIERAASLTNAGRGRVRVIRGDQIVGEFRFPEGAVFTTDAPGSEGITAQFSFGGEVYAFELHDKESRHGTRPFEGTDRLLLDALSRQVQASLENHYLLRQAVEKQKIEQDIATAAAIQRRILPRTMPMINGYDIAGANLPSITVSGDYFDCIPLTDGRTALIIADVAGKGVSAALLVSTFHAFLKAYLESSLSLGHLANKLNRVISQASTDEKFITAFIALLTPETGEVETLNAGHTPAYWRTRNGTVRELGVGGLPFGMLDTDLAYEVENATLEPGDRLLLYTDGITEARNSSDDLFDNILPLAGFVARQAPREAETFINALLAEIRGFTGSAPQSDDITALYLLRH